jgi:hypothetical protein
MPRAPKQSVTKPSAAAPASEKPKVSRVDWLGHTEWVDRLVAELLDKPQIRLRLFSDSIEKAKNEGRSKVNTNGNPKKIHHAALAKAIWDRDGEAERAHYINNPPKYATAVDGKIQR